MAEINSTYAGIMPKVNFAPANKKTVKEEVKEITQNPDDPLAKYPLRAFGYSNEVGAAVSAMPVWGKAAESALWVPALMFLGADIYDKYKRGKDGNYSNASVTKAVEQATFQGLASVLLPTAAVKLGQGLVGNLTKYGKNKLTATAQEEMYRKLLGDFDKGKFAKADYVNSKGVKVEGFDKVLNKVLDQEGFYEQMAKTRHDLKTEGVWSKISRFFGHSQRPVVSAKSDEKIVENFLKNKAKDVYDLQTVLDSGDESKINALKDKGLVKKFQKVLSKNAKQGEDLVTEAPGYVIKKILNSNDEKLKDIKSLIMRKYKSHLELKALTSSKSLSTALLGEIAENAEHKKLINGFAKRIDAVRKVLRTYIKGKEMNLGLLKTAAGFATLALFAVPIDHFVHKYIIKKMVEPGLENVEKLHSKLSFKQGDYDDSNAVVKTKVRK